MLDSVSLWTQLVNAFLNRLEYLFLLIILIGLGTLVWKIVDKALATFSLYSSQLGEILEGISKNLSDMKEDIHVLSEKLQEIAVQVAIHENELKHIKELKDSSNPNKPN